MITAAYHHWPEAHPQQFYDRDEFRLWAQMKSGYYTVQRMSGIRRVTPSMAREIVKAAFEATETRVWPEIRNNELVLFQPKSIKFAEMGPQEFSQLCDDVRLFLSRELGMDVERLMREHENAA